MFTINELKLLEKMNDKRTKCTVYTRVMGYHRPVESFNKGKLGEHKQRLQFKQPKSCGGCTKDCSKKDK